MKNIILFFTILIITISMGGTAGSAEGIISAASPAPEPATMLLLGIGVFSLSAVIRKKLIR